jgi:hypothetical protein
MNGVVVSVFIVVILLSSPSVWAFSANPTLSAGQQYSLQLQGIKQNIGGNDYYTPPDKDMTVTLGRTDKGNLMMEFEWTHDPGSGVAASNYGLILGFDFNNDGTWTDPDASIGLGSVYTPDDALGLIALGPNIDICLGKGCSWLNVYIPSGLYVASWGIDPNTNNGADPATWVFIGGPPGPQSGPHGSTYEGVKGPGPQYPGSTPGNLNPIEFTPYATGYTGTSYVMKVGVPLQLFAQSPAGFGFFLAQQTAVCVDSDCGTPWLTWIWPKQGTLPTDFNLLTALGQKDTSGAGTGAGLLGNLDPNAEGPYNYALADPPTYSNEPVGGFATAADRIALVAPWVALTSILGVALVIAVRMAKRHKA